MSYVYVCILRSFARSSYAFIRSLSPCSTFSVVYIHIYFFSSFFFISLLLLRRSCSFSFRVPTVKLPFCLSPIPVFVIIFRVTYFSVHFIFVNYVPRNTTLTAPLLPFLLYASLRNYLVKHCAPFFLFFISLSLFLYFLFILQSSFATQLILAKLFQPCTLILFCRSLRLSVSPGKFV